MQFVLIHGAWHGSWCWRDVVAELRQRGHRVLAPTLPGLAERADLLAKRLSITDMVMDVSTTIIQEQLQDVILVGHSFGGNVITGVADQAADRLSKLIYLDASIPESGRSVFDQLSRRIVAERIAAAQDHDGGLSIPVPPASAFGLTDPEHVRRAEAMMTPHPLYSYQSPLDLQNPVGNSLPAAYIVCTKPIYQPLELSRHWVRTHGWPVYELESAHDAMVISPEATTQLLLEIATAI